MSDDFLIEMEKTSKKQAEERLKEQLREGELEKEGRENMSEIDR